MWKIGYDAKRLFNNFTGLGNYSRNLLRQIPLRYPEFEFHLYTPGVKPELFPADGDNQFKIHLPNSSFKALWRSYLINNMLIDDGIQLYHGLSNEIPFRFPTKKIKSVVTIHDLIFKIYPENYPKIDREIYNLKFKYACKNADLILATSQQTKNDIIRYYHIHPEKINVLYQSCHPEFSIQKTQEQQINNLKKYHLPENYMLYVGSLEARKNLLILLTAYSLLPRDLQIKLVLVGRKSSYKSVLLNKIQELKLQDKVDFIHDLNSVKDLSSLYQAAKLFIYPSIYEGFGIPLIEAAYSKTAIITSNQSSLPEAAGPYCNFFNAFSPEDLSIQIEKLLINLDYRTHSINNTFVYATQHFDPVFIQNQLIAHYKLLLES